MMMTDEWITVLEHAEGLIDMLLASEVVTEYHRAYDDVYFDEKLVNQIQDFMAMKEQYEEVQRFGRFTLMIPASRAVVNKMTTSGPMKKPRNPISFSPINIAISVGSGESPIWEPITFGSTVRRMMSKTAAKIANFVPLATSPLMNWYNDQGARIMMEPRIGMTSMIQMTSDMTIAYFGTIKSNPTNETARMMKLTNSCAFINPKMTEFSLVIK